MANKSKGKSKKGSGKGGGSARAPRQAQTRRSDPFRIQQLIDPVLKGGRELLTVNDPLEAESWASVMLGLFYKKPVPVEVQQELERRLLPMIVEGAERMRNRAGLAVLCAMASVTGAPAAQEAAERMMAHGVAPPPWAAEIGRPELLEAWSSADSFGDQVGYYFTFRYADRPLHLALALYDENLGGVIKDAAIAPLAPGAETRDLKNLDPDVETRPADPVDSATSIINAIATGDLFVDNHWTTDYIEHRALLVSRMRLLIGGGASRKRAAKAGSTSRAAGVLTTLSLTGAPMPPSPAALEPAEPPAPPDLDAQETLIQEFLATPAAAGLSAERDVTLAVLDHCMIARCDYGDGDPLRWSPIVAELFMLDYLPRKATMDFRQVAALPEVLTAWVRFCLGKRGLDERFIVETEEAIAQFTPEFRQAVTDPQSFGPAKALWQAMSADGVDVTDQDAVQAWIADFNARPFEERGAFLGPRLDV